MSRSLSKEGLKKLARWQSHIVETGRVPSSHVLVWRDGKVKFDHCTGARTSATPNAKDTIYRLYSMTKPIVSLALMTLFEEGKLLLSHPVHLYLGPAWKKQNMSVYASGSYAKDLKTVPCQRTITVKHVLTHTSGIPHGFDVLGIDNKVDEIYAQGGYYQAMKGGLQNFVRKLPEAPLLFQPGSAWVYGYNTDVVAALVEVISGKPLDVFLRERILDPLGMCDTDFFVPEEKYHRFTSLWMPAGATESMAAVPDQDEEPKFGLKEIDFAWHPDPEVRAKTHRWSAERRTRKPTYLSGVAGLCGTTYDYARFCEMLMHGGRSPTTHARICSSKTIEFMTRNHLTKDGRVVSLTDMSTPGGYTEMTSTQGVGFGLGFSVILDRSLTQEIETEGTFSWGGAASTIFICDPKENLFVVMMTALRYRNEMQNPLKSNLLQHVYACIDDDPQDTATKGKGCPEGSSVEQTARAVGLPETRYRLKSSL